jgi:hypothetical protein
MLCSTTRSRPRQSPKARIPRPSSATSGSHFRRAETKDPDDHSDRGEAPHIVRIVRSDENLSKRARQVSREAFRSERARLDRLAVVAHVLVDRPVAGFPTFGRLLPDHTQDARSFLHGAAAKQKRVDEEGEADPAEQQAAHEPDRRLEERRADEQGFEHRPEDRRRRFECLSAPRRRNRVAFITWVRFYLGPGLPVREAFHEPKYGDTAISPIIENRRMARATCHDRSKKGDIQPCYPFSNMPGLRCWR